MVLPVVADLIAMTLPVATNLVPVSLGQLGRSFAAIANAAFAGESIVELVASVARRELRNARPLISETGKRRRSATGSTCNAGANDGASAQRGER
jgi:hypothetical protein